jgi:hypothetical protein
VRGACVILITPLVAVTAPAPGQCPQSTLLASDAAPGAGFANALDAEGGLICAGAPSDGAGSTFLGAAYVFRLQPRGWIEEAKLVPRDAHPDDFFGSAIAVNGARLLIGAPAPLNNGDGAIYCYRHDGTSWIEDPIPAPPGLAPGDRHGAAVALHGPWAIAGAYADDDHGSQAGAVHVYHDDGTGFAFHSTLLADDGGSNDQFGYAVALDLPFLAVGAWGRDGRATNDGAVYVHRLERGVWVCEAVLTASDGAALDELGRSVSIAGELILAGARRGGSPAIESGSAYVFQRVAGAWVEVAELLPAGGAAGDRFGEAVSLRGETAVLGGPFAGGSGGIAIFDRMDGSWTERVALRPPGGAPGDRFGQAVRIWDDRIVAGAPGTDAAGDGSGSASVLVGAAAIDCNANGAADACDLLARTSPDCNGNSVPDECDVASGRSPDRDGDGVPDECRCPGDADGDGAVNVVDLVLVLQQWGRCGAGTCPDLDGDGAVTVADLVLVLQHWGDCG